MNIVLVGPVYPYRGGIAHHTMMLARTLAPDHNLLTVSFQRQYPGWLYPGRTDKDPSQRPLKVEAEYLLDPFNLLTWWSTVNRITRFGPQLVVFQWWTTVWAACFGTVAHMLRRNGVRSAFLIHNVIPHEKLPLDRIFARYALASADFNIVQGENERRSLLTLLPRARVWIGRLPLFSMLGGPLLPVAEARAKLALPEHLPLVLFFGLVRPYKGLKYLIDAIAELRRDGLAVGLVIAGEFWDGEQEYLRQIDALDLRAYTFIFNTYIADELVNSFMSACDVMAAPYLNGTQSAVVNLAARYCMKIVKTTLLDDKTSAGNEHSTDWIVAPADAHALALAIRSALISTRRRSIPFDDGWGNLAGVIIDAALNGNVPHGASH